MKGIAGVGVFGSKNYMNAHVKTCEHIQGRGSAEWMATKRGYMRKVGESMEQGATDEDRKRRLAAFRLIDVDLVLKLVGDALPRRAGRRLDPATGAGSSLSSVCEDSGAGAEVSQPGAGELEASSHHKGVDEAAKTAVVALPPQVGGVLVAPAGAVGESASWPAPVSARDSGALVLGGTGSGEEVAPAPLAVRRGGGVVGRYWRWGGVATIGVGLSPGLWQCRCPLAAGWQGLC